MDFDLTESLKLYEETKYAEAAKTAMAQFKSLCDSFDTQRVSDREYVWRFKDCISHFTDFIIDIFIFSDLTENEKEKLTNAIERQPKIFTLSHFGINDFSSIHNVLYNFQKDPIVGLNHLLNVESFGLDDQYIRIKKYHYLMSCQRYDDVASLIVSDSSYDYYVQEDFKSMMANGETDTVAYITKRIVESPDLQSNFRGDNAYHTALQGDVSGWLSLYLSIVEANCDKSSTKTYLTKVFTQNGGDLEAYHKLKAMVASSEWKPFIYKAIKEIRQEHWQYDDNIMQILDEEEEYELLLNHILGLRPNLTKLCAYADHAKSIPTDYSKELVSGFGVLVERYAPKPQYTDQLANALASLHCVSGCRKYIEEVITDLKAKYPRRRKLMSLLDGIA